MGCLTVVPLWFASWLVVALTPNAKLAEGKQWHADFQYERCLEALEQARALESTAAEKVEIELYGGLCEFGRGREKAADARFERALRLDREASLPPFTSPKIVQRFRAVQARLPPPPKPAPPPAPQPVESAVTSPPPRPVPWLPITFAGAGLAAAGAGLYFGLDARALEARSNEVVDDSDAARFLNDARGQARNANISYAVAATALIAAGITYWLQTR